MSRDPNLQRHISRVRAAAEALQRQLWVAQTGGMTLLALIVGCGVGASTVVMVLGIEVVTGLAQASRESFDGAGGLVIAALTPACGGLIVGLLVHGLKVGSRVLDVADVIAAAGMQEGPVDLRHALVNGVASIVTIGSGGSAGRESPLIQIGAALGSALGRLYRLDNRRIVSLVGSGSAAGLAATFGAPLAGIMFALEVVLGEVSLRSFAPLVLSAFAASLVSRGLLGSTLTFAVPSAPTVLAADYVLCIPLGLAAGVVAWLFVDVLTHTESVLDQSALKPYMKPAVGGLLVGVLGIFWPAVLGMGFQTIGQALEGQVAPSVLLTLAAVKILATSFTLASGGAGSFISPLLFVGAAMGGAFASIVNGMIPGMIAGAGGYVLVGMAAVFAGVTRAPATAVLLVFEMTQDYEIVVPVVLGVIVSTAVASRLQRQTVYTLELTRHGSERQPGYLPGLMDVMVADAMTPIEAMQTVARSTSLEELDRLFRETGHHGFIVLDEEGRLFGVVTLSDLQHVIEAGKTGAVAGDICTRNVLTVFSDETVEDALRRLALLDVGRLPVVERRDPRRVVGVLRRSDIIHAYARALLEPFQEAAAIARSRLQAATGASVVEFILGRDDFAANQQLRNIGLPEDCVVISIHRRGRVVIPRGSTRLLAGDRVIILKVATSVETLRAILHGGPQASKKP